MSDAMPNAAKVFLTTKLDIKYMKPGIEWYPRVDVQLAWLQEFALSVTQSQAATIAEQEKTIERLRFQLVDREKANRDVSADGDPAAPC